MQIAFVYKLAPNLLAPWVYFTWFPCWNKKRMVPGACFDDSSSCILVSGTLNTSNLSGLFGLEPPNRFKSTWNSDSRLIFVNGDHAAQRAITWWVSNCFLLSVLVLKPIFGSIAARKEINGARSYYSEFIGACVCQNQRHIHNVFECKDNAACCILV